MSQNRTTYAAYATVTIGIVCMYLGEVWPDLGEFAVPGGLLVLSAFLIVTGIDLRKRGHNTTANIWIVITASSRVAYIAFLYNGIWDDYMHIGLQGTNLLLVGTEIYAGLLQGQSPIIAKKENEIATLREELATAQDDLQSAREEITETLYKMQESSNGKKEHANELQSLKDAIAQKESTLSEMTKQSAKAMQLFDRLEGYGVQCFKSNRFVCINWPGIIKGGNPEQCTVTGDTEQQLEKRKAANF